MARNSRVVVFFLLLLAGAEAERITSSASLAAASRAQIQAHGFEGHSSAARNKTMDLDWPGCGAKVGLLFGESCHEIDGCQRQKLWLDTPRQSCRFSDSYKLQPENVPRFLPVELARLEEKSATFAKHGCLFGGWWMKCYRRIRQIIRLLKYVRRAVTDAKKDTSHPAHALATTGEMSDRINRVADNLAEGFRKYEAKLEGEAKADFASGFGMLKAMPDSLRAVAAATESAENRSLTGEERGAMENVAAVEAMLKVVGTDLDEAQRAELYARIEAGGPLGGGEDELDAGVEDLVRSLDEAIDEADGEDRGNLERHDDEDDEEDPEDAAAQAADDEEDPEALVQVAGRAGSGSSGAVQARGTGPLKWLFKNGLGWIVSRVSWLLLFLVGTAVGLIRGAVLFPLLFVGCTLSKFVWWVFHGVGYDLLWEGETGKVAQDFLDIGKCAPWMWDAVGFDSSVDNTANQIFLQPARFASYLTGVHHLYKGARDLCEGVTCGSHALCQHGRCVCHRGFFPDAATPGHCSLAPTAAGCRCKASWTESELLVFTKHHYGCPPRGECEVSTHDASYGTCKGGLQGGGGGIWEMLGSPSHPRDRCVPAASLSAVVPKLTGHSPPAGA